MSILKKMPKKKPGQRPRLDDPANQERVFEFCRACGREEYEGKHCFDGIVSRPRYYAYKSSHPDFAEKIAEACHLFFVIALKENPKRAEDTWAAIDDQIQNGIIETRVFSEFKYKTDDNGNLILDSKTNQPIPDKLIGTAKQYVIRKPCSSSLLQYVADKFEKASQQS